MTLNDGQIAALLTAAGGLIVGVIGYVGNRYGTYTNRQTATEAQLWKRIETNEERIDSLTASMQAMENQHRAEIAGLEKEIDDLRKLNITLMTENARLNALVTEHFITIVGKKQQA